MGKVVINEDKLMTIIKESIKSILNEIGDTPQGFLALKNAEEKAFNNIRPQQGEKFQKYTKDIDGGEIVKANNKMILWQGNTTRGVIDGPGGGEPGSFQIYEPTKGGWKTIAHVDGEAKTRLVPYDAKCSKKTARKIALWVKNNFPDANPVWFDWHTYASL